MRTRYGLQTLTMLHAPHLHMQAWGKSIRFIDCNFVDGVLGYQQSGDNI